MVSTKPRINFKINTFFNKNVEIKTILFRTPKYNNNNNNNNNNNINNGLFILTNRKKINMHTDQ